MVKSVIAEPSTLQFFFESSFSCFACLQAFLKILLPLFELSTHSQLIGSIRSSTVNAHLANLKLWLGPQQGLQAVATILSQMHASGWQVRRAGSN